MKMEKFEEIKALLDTAKRLRGIVPNYREAIKDSRCDKHDLKFSLGSDFSVFAVKVGLSCYTGYYGSSSCSSMTSVGGVHAQEFLVGALNRHMETILNTMAELAEQKAQKFKAEAAKELQEANSVLDSLAQSGESA
jgi:hypothetical protein